jgi:hypothetical protein
VLTYNFRWSAFATLVLVASGVAAEAPPADRLERLVRQLGHRSFAQREAASRELESLDALAGDALRRAADKDPDPEVRDRAGRLLHSMRSRQKNRFLASVTGSWKDRDGAWMKIATDRWTSGTPTFGPVAGVIWVNEINGAIARVELAVQEGPTQGRTVKAILRRDGDKLSYCGTFDDRYPIEFKTAGTNCAYELQRQK